MVWVLSFVLGIYQIFGKHVTHKSVHILPNVHVSYLCSNILVLIGVAKLYYSYRNECAISIPTTGVFRDIDILIVAYVHFVNCKGRLKFLEKWNMKL